MGWLPGWDGKIKKNECQHFSEGLFQIIMRKKTRILLRQTESLPKYTMIRRAVIFALLAVVEKRDPIDALYYSTEGSELCKVVNHSKWAGCRDGRQEAWKIEGMVNCIWSFSLLSRFIGKEYISLSAIFFSVHCMVSLYSVRVYPAGFANVGWNQSRWTKHSVSSNNSI